ncbi:MAG: GcrA family cell cycle regulator [Pseudomonadota bacterium]
MAWNEERVEMLKQLWAEGLSASQIAGKMGGVTRNAVIGKVHRLGLSGRAAPAKPQRGRTFSDESAPPQTASAAEPEAPAITEPEFIAPLQLDDGELTTVASLSKNMCRWPIGDPATDDFHFCGKPTAVGKSYCAYHARLAFQPSQRRPEPRKEAPRQITAENGARRRAG